MSILNGKKIIIIGDSDGVLRLNRRRRNGPGKSEASS